MYSQVPALKISQFEGPLDLLYHLIEKNKLDIYDIPIAEVTDQYLAYLQKLDELDLDLASDFLLMASTLLHIKSRLLLPRPQLTAQQEADPREELVLRLLEYRRCKTIAADLEERYARYSETMLKLAEPPARLGLALHKDEQELDWDLFSQAGLRLVQQNKARFHDQKDKMAHILQREKVSLQTKMRQIWRYVTSKSRVFFNEIFPLAKTSRLERLTAFLALLEMMRLNRILVRQDRPFDVIMLEENKLAGGDAARIEQDLLAAVKEKEYD